MLVGLNKNNSINNNFDILILAFLNPGVFTAWNINNNNNNNHRHHHNHNYNNIEISPQARASPIETCVLGRIDAAYCCGRSSVVDISFCLSGCLSRPRPCKAADSSEMLFEM